MNMKAILMAILLASVFLVGCTEKSNTSGYASYTPPPQQQYVGGGCGVAPSSDYTDAPINSMASASSAA